MAFSEELAQRIRRLLAQVGQVDEKRMFGGVAFMVRGNMACGVLGPDIIVRVGPASYAEALTRPGARVFDMTGKPMSGWVRVSPAGHVFDDAALARWVAQGVAFAESLPAK